MSTSLSFLERFRTRVLGVAGVMAIAAGSGFFDADVVVAAEKKARPVCSFERAADLRIIRPAGARVERVKKHATDGQFALRCLFPGSKVDTWPGLDWQPRGIDVSKYDMLSFDVFNPGPARVSLSWRVDDAAGHKVFGGAPLPPGKTSRVDISFRSLVGRLDVHRISRVYPYISRPHKDVLLYFDHFRLDYFSLRFTPLVYHEDGPFAVPGAAARKRGFMLFHRHWMDFVFPVSRPRPGEIPKALHACAAPGETEPITVSVRALRPLKQVRVRLGRLLGPNGAVIDGGASPVYVVRCLNKRVTYSSKQYIRSLPVYLARQAAADVPAEHSQRFWIDLRVPEQAVPGLYSGMLRILDSRGAAAELPVRVRVWPFHLKEPRQILGDYYQTPRPAATDAEKLARLEKDLRDMRSRGATSVGLCFGCPVKQAVLDSNGTVHLNLPPDCLYVRFMNLYRDLGFPAPVVQLSDSGQGFAASHGFAFGTPEYARAYQAFWKAMRREAKARGWPEIIVQPVDEPQWHSEEERKRNLVLLKLLKQIPGQRTEEDGPGDAYFHRVAGPWADIWNYNGSIGTPAQLAAARKGRHRIMVYNCDVESWRPEIDRYVDGFYQARASLDGAYNWAYISYYGSPYDDLDARTGTWMHFYPKLGKEPGGPSIGWEGFREGVDDLRYVTTLRAAIRAASSSEDERLRALGRGAAARLGAVLDTLEYHRRIRGTGAWASKRRSGRGYAIRGPYRLPNGWTFPEYDVARATIALETWRLLARMGRAPSLPAWIAGPGRAPGRLLPTPADEAGASIVVESSSAGAKTAGDAEASRPLPFLAIPVLPGKVQVRLDGVADEPVWRRSARTVELRRNGDGGLPRARTIVRLAADSATLYVAFECREPRIRYLTATVTRDGGPTWKDDCVELFVDPSGQGRGFRQIVVNCLGKQFWKATDRRGWRAASRAAAHIGAERWGVELAVPLAALGLRPGRMFGLNLCRERRPTEVFELSAWSPTGDGFGRAERFGAAVLGEGGGLRSVRFGPPTVGRHVCRARIAAAPVAERCRLDLRISRGSKTRLIHGQATGVPRGGSAELTCLYQVPDAAGPLHIEVSLVRVEGARARPVIRLHRVQAIRPLLAGVRISPALAYADSPPRRFRIDIPAPPGLRRALRVVAAVVPMGASGMKPLVSQRLEVGDSGPITGKIVLNGVAPGAYRFVVRAQLPEAGSKPFKLERPLIVGPVLFPGPAGR